VSAFPIQIEVLPVIETRGLTKLFKDKKRGEIRAVDGV